jgi:RNA polymerase sigma-70 factor (ECF subfamily)
MELPAESLSEEELVARAVRGERAAYRALYQRTVGMVRSRLCHLLGRDPDCEDITQQVFLEVFAQLHRFRGEARFRTFLWRVAVNVAIDHRSHRRRRHVPVAPGAYDSIGAADPSPEEQTEHRQRLTLVLSLLERIKPKKRAAFRLRVIEGLPLEEVAHQVGSNPATVGLRIRSARAELQTMLARRQEWP